MLRLNVFAIILMSCIALQAQEFKFNSNGEFKILQFTDSHYNHTNPKCQLVFEMMNEVLDIEKPDLVIFTGDIATEKNMKAAWQKITEPLVKRAVPWTFTLGNHDGEWEVDKEEIFNIIADIPYCMAVQGDKKAAGTGNALIQLKAHQTNKTEALIYCMDSHDYAQMKGVGKYSWFEKSQIDWYINTGNKWKKKNNGEALPALAYFHIPLPEYNQAWENDKIKPVGEKHESVCAPQLNTGMYAAMLLQGDVMATFVGHDHANDFIGEYNGIALAYGRFSGGTNTYSHMPRGARIVVLKEGKRAFTTWIRQVGGAKVNETSYPFSQK